MCKILTIINKNKDSNNTIQKIIEANIDTLKTERSGYSVYRDNKTFNYIGDPAYQSFADNIKYKGERIYILHTRTKTAGSDGIEGLHLQNIDGYVFAHNGLVDRYSTVKEKSDSYYFFKHLLKKYPIPNDKSIAKQIRRSDFSGRGFLYNEKKKELIAFFESEGQITLLKNAVILSSYDIETKIKTFVKKQIMGFIWYEDEKEEELKGIIHQENINDLYLKFKNSKLISRRIMDTTTQYDYSQNGKKWSLTEDQQKQSIISQLADYFILIDEEDLKGKKNITSFEADYINDEIKDLKEDFHKEFSLQNTEIDKIVAERKKEFFKDKTVIESKKDKQINIYPQNGYYD